MLKLSKKQLDDLYEKLLSSADPQAQKAGTVNFSAFRNACIADLDTRFKANF